MKCQILFSWKNKKNITNLSSAESAHSMVSVKAMKITLKYFSFMLRYSMAAWEDFETCQTVL